MVGAFEKADLRVRSAPKKAWCCEHSSRGCEATTSKQLHDCYAGRSSKWPCINGRVTGHENWEMGWSPEKKHYCCSTMNLACGRYDRRFRT